MRNGITPQGDFGANNIGAMGGFLDDATSWIDSTFFAPGRAVAEAQAEAAKTKVLMQKIMLAAAVLVAAYIAYRVVTKGGPRKRANPSYRMLNEDERGSITGKVVVPVKRKVRRGKRRAR